QTQAAALAILNASYLVVSFGTQDDNVNPTPAAAGTVIVQSPVANQAVQPNSTVNVTLSSGNAPPPVVLPTSVVPIIKSSTLLLQETASQYIFTPPPIFDIPANCLAGPTDLPGRVYRFQHVPSSAIFLDLFLANEANPTGSVYKGGIYNAFNGSI